MREFKVGWNKYREEMRQFREYTKSQFHEVSSQLDEMSSKLDTIIELLPNWMRRQEIEPLDLVGAPLDHLNADPEESTHVPMADNSKPMVMQNWIGHSSREPVDDRTLVVNEMPDSKGIISCESTIKHSIDEENEQDEENDDNGSGMLSFMDVQSILGSVYESSKKVSTNGSPKSWVRGVTFRMDVVLGENAMKEDAHLMLDKMTKAIPINVFEVDKGMASNQNNNALIFAKAQLCWVDLYSLGKNDLMCTTFIQCKNVDSLIVIEVMFYFDPGGCSLPHKGCDLFEFNREQGDYCLATIRVDLSVKAVTHIIRIRIASVCVVDVLIDREFSANGLRMFVQTGTGQMGHYVNDFPVHYSLVNKAIKEDSKVLHKRDIDESSCVELIAALCGIILQNGESEDSCGGIVDETLGGSVKLFVYFFDTDLYAYFNWLKLARLLLCDTSEVDEPEVHIMTESQQKGDDQFVIKRERVVMSSWCNNSSPHTYSIMTSCIVVELTWPAALVSLAYSPPCLSHRLSSLKGHSTIIMQGTSKVIKRLVYKEMDGMPASMVDDGMANKPLVQCDKVFVRDKILLNQAHLYGTQIAEVDEFGPVLENFLLFIYEPGGNWNTELRKLGALSFCKVILSMDGLARKSQMIFSYPSYEYFGGIICLNMWVELSTLVIYVLVSRYVGIPLLKCLDNQPAGRVLTPILIATSKFGSGLFLVQLICLVDSVFGWIDKWVGFGEQFWYMVLLLVSLVCYVATFFVPTTLENLVWDPGQCVISAYILEDKDVFERVGKWIIPMDITWVKMKVTKDVQNNCITMGWCEIDRYLRLSCDNMLQTEQYDERLAELYMGTTQMVHFVWGQLKWFIEEDYYLKVYLEVFFHKMEAIIHTGFEELMQIQCKTFSLDDQAWVNECSVDAFWMDHLKPGEFLFMCMIGLSKIPRKSGAFLRLVYFAVVMTILAKAILEGSQSCLGFSFHHLEDKAVVEGMDLSCPEV